MRLLAQEAGGRGFSRAYEQRRGGRDAGGLLPGSLHRKQGDTLQFAGLESLKVRKRGCLHL